MNLSVKLNSNTRKVASKKDQDFEAWWTKVQAMLNSPVDYDHPYVSQYDPRTKFQNGMSAKGFTDLVRMKFSS